MAAENAGPTGRPANLRALKTALNAFHKSLAPWREEVKRKKDLATDALDVLLPAVHAADRRVRRVPGWSARAGLLGSAVRTDADFDFYLELDAGLWSADGITAAGVHPSVVLSVSPERVVAVFQAAVGVAARRWNHSQIDIQVSAPAGPSRSAVQLVAVRKGSELSVKLHLFPMLKLSEVEGEVKTQFRDHFVRCRPCAVARSLPDGPLLELAGLVPEPERSAWSLSPARLHKQWLKKVGSRDTCHRQIFQMLKGMSKTIWAVELGVDIPSYSLLCLLFWEVNQHPKSEEWQRGGMMARRMIGVLEKLRGAVRKELIKPCLLPQHDCFVDVGSGDFDRLQSTLEDWIYCFTQIADARESLWVPKFSDSDSFTDYCESLMTFCADID